MCISQDRIGYAVVTNNPKTQWLDTTNVYFRCYISKEKCHCRYSGTQADWKLNFNQQIPKHRMARMKRSDQLAGPQCNLKLTHIAFTDFHWPKKSTWPSLTLKGSAFLPGSKTEKKHDHHVQASPIMPFHKNHLRVFQRFSISLFPTGFSQYFYSFTHEKMYTWSRDV